MRERKYRAWDKVQEEFIYSDQVAGGMWRYFKLLEDRGIRHFESEDWTGLLDKNGKEIYEGDIVKFWFFYWVEARIGDVRCNAPNGGFNLIEERDDEECYIEIDSNMVFEVIGNIWENKELLK